METVTKISGWVVTGFAIAVICGLAFVLSGPGNKMGWWNFMTGFKILGISVLGLVVALILCIAGLVISLKHASPGGTTMSIIGILIPFIIIGVLVNTMIKAKNIPIINDITTDTINPPQFVKILDMRKDSPVPAIYPGPETAAKQIKAFPDIKTLNLNMPTDSAFDNALAAAQKLGWIIVDQDKAAGRIEATDTTKWFGFKDDIVIRITKSGTVASSVDIRSVSRVGKGDMGTNVKRITAFLKAMGGNN